MVQILHIRTRMQTRIPNPMDTLYYVELYPLHGFGFRSQFGFLTLDITVPTLGMDLQFTLNSFTQTKGMESSLDPNLNQWKNPA